MSTRVRPGASGSVTKSHMQSVVQANVKLGKTRVYRVPLAARPLSEGMVGNVACPPSLTTAPVPSWVPNWVT